MSATAQKDQASLVYARQACVNLEQLFAAWEDRESVRHFQKRQREIEQKIVNRPSPIVNPK